MSKGLSPSLPNPASVTSDDKRTYRGIQEGIHPSPVVQLNRAVAIAMVEGPGPALAILDQITAAGQLENYHLLHATRADLLRRQGSLAEAAASYERALALTGNESERRFLARRLQEIRAIDTGAAAAKS